MTVAQSAAAEVSYLLAAKQGPSHDAQVAASSSTDDVAAAPTAEVPLLPLGRSVADHARSLRLQNDVLLSVSHPLQAAALGGGVRSSSSAGIERLAALRRMCSLEAVRQEEAEQEVAAMRGRAGRRASRFRHYVLDVCPELDEAALPGLVGWGL